MKPIKLTMNAFGSYASKTDIDFTKLGERGLYLITGDTGAGKTTIFDAISYALFGEPSGETRSGDRSLRCDGVSESVETYVEFAFSHLGKAYSIRRNMSYSGKRARGEGTALRKDDAVLRGQDGAVRQGVRAVNEAVVDLLGVTREHFSKIMMIAQGDFARLLMAGTHDREPILRDIFGTLPYSLFQTELSERAAALSRERAPLEARILSLIKEISAPDARLSERLGAIKTAYTAQSAVDIIDETAVSDARRAAELSETRAKTEEKRLEIMSFIASAEQTNANIAALAETDNKLALLTSRSEDIDAMRAELSLAERAERVSPVETARSLAHKNLKKYQAALANEQSKLAPLTEKFDSAQKLLSELYSRKPHFDALLASRNAIMSRLSAYGDIEAHEKQRGETALRLEDALGALSETHKLQTEVSFRRGEISAELPKLAGAAAELEREKARKNALAERGRRLSETVLSCIFLKKLAENRDILRTESERATLESTQKTAVSAQKRQAFLFFQAGIMASALVENEPCPVCGSREHPSPARASSDAPSQRDIELMQTEADAAAQLASELASRAAAANADIEARLSAAAAELTALAGKAIKSDIPALLKTAEALNRETAGQLRASDESIAALNEKAERYACLSAEFEALSQKLDGCRAEEVIKRDEAQTARTELSKLSGVIDTLRADLPFLTRADAEHEVARLDGEYSAWESGITGARNAVSGAENAIAASKSAATQISETITELERDCEASEAALTAALAENGFDSAAELFTATRDREAMSRLSSAIKQHDRELNYLTKTREALEKTVNGAVPVDINAQKLALEAAAKAYDEVVSELNALAARSARNASAKRELVETCAAFARTDAQCRDYAALSGVAGGRLAGAAKITFERYMQQEYFDRVLNRANTRFSKMSNGQFELRRAETAQDLRSQSGLDINVLNLYTGAERSVRTLSGGESFMASLSLALGLADEVTDRAGGLKMDSLFIDEGFGSLDPQSLDQVMRVLDSLSSGDKLIGVISHVADMRDRIARKIIVTRSREGSSARVE